MPQKHCNNSSSLQAVRALICTIIFSSLINLSVFSWGWPSKNPAPNNQASEINQASSTLQEQKLESSNNDNGLFGGNDGPKKDKFDWLKRNKNKLDEKERSERKAAKDKGKEEKKKLKQMEKENKLLKERQKLQSNMQQNQVRLYDLNRKQSFKDKILRRKNAGHTVQGGLLMNQ